MLRQLNATEADAQLYGRLASSVIYANAVAARRSRRPVPQPPRPIRTVGLRDLRRPADRAAADRRRGEHRPGPPARAGARVLALEGTGRRSGDLERGSRRLPAGAAGPDHGPDRRRHRSAHRRPARRHLRAARRADVGARIASCCNRWRAPSSPTGAAPSPSRSTGAAPRRRAIPRFAPTRSDRAEIAPVAPPARDLILFNGLGGFTPDGSRVRHHDAARIETTPAPWVNVLANPNFGTVISESGSAYTWSENAHEFRLTPWHNDPVSDASGEAFYLRDEETGHFWSPTPLPAAAQAPTSPGTDSATASSSIARMESPRSSRCTSHSTRRSSSRC